MIPDAPLGPMFRLGPNRHYKAYGSYETARAMARCSPDDPELYIEAGRRGELAQLPPEPFTLHVRLGDVIRCAHARHGELHPGDGRAKRRGGIGAIAADAPWVMVNMDHRTARVVQRSRTAA